MKVNLPSAIFVLVVAGMPVVAGAEVPVGVYAKAGTLGFGGGVGIGITDSLRGRVGYTTYKISKDVTETDVNYHGDLKLGGAEALLDWHPFEGTFRITGGLVFNRNKITVDGKPSNGTYTINDNTYTAAEVGSLDGDIKFKSTAPYIGIGWGDVAKKEGHFSFVADIGVMFQGSPDAKLNVSCGTAVPTATCDQLHSDVAEEQSKLNHDLSSYKYWPVIDIGLAYRF